MTERIEAVTGFVIRLYLRAVSLARWRACDCTLASVASQTCFSSDLSAISFSWSNRTGVEAMVNHIKRIRGVQKVTLIGWSWGAMMTGYHASLHSENVHKLVLYAPLYNFNDHTNLGPGSAFTEQAQAVRIQFCTGGLPARFGSREHNAMER
jgi:pimeloyl-ACP methyl ester carboxylesterase